MPFLSAARLRINLGALKSNIDTARSRLGPGPLICLPVKADAYGHGMIPVARAALEAGVQWLAVSEPSEGAALREAGIKAPILLLYQSLPLDLDEIIALDLVPLVHDREFIEECRGAAERAGKQLTVHLKVDTGMGRFGCRPEEAAPLAGLIASSPRLRLGGLATHFSAADSPEADDLAYTQEQIRRFKEAASAVKAAGINPGLLHGANSGALCFHQDSYFDMVRPGLFLYGYSPSPSLAAEPLMALTSKVVSIKKVLQGEAVSYGRTWIASQDTCIGIIPLGYADGFSRSLSGRHRVSIRGRTYPLVGRICMAHCMIDLGPSPEVQRWDEVTIFGNGHGSAADLADLLGTIPYEITCTIHPRVPREYYPC
ncbi:MAG: alanine racemase [Treponema sp.]|nr:alanine racemase [Treponema sp.]